jgi:hypothetical protein
MTPMVFVETTNLATCQWKIANLLVLCHVETIG